MQKPRYLGKHISEPCPFVLRTMLLLKQMCALISTEQSSWADCYTWPIPFASALGGFVKLIPTSWCHLPA